MSKDPAVLWYTSDFLTGTAHFELDEVGMYSRLLAFQHQQGHLSIDFIKRVGGRKFKRIWPVIQSKFSTDEAGLFFNERMDIEIGNRRSNSIKNKENAVKRWDKFRNANAMPLENENENENREEGGMGEEGITVQPFAFDLKTKLPDNVLEAAELSQFSLTAKKHTEFIKSQWKVFLSERMLENTGKRYYRLSDLTTYFLNWIRAKHPKKQDEIKPNGSTHLSESSVEKLEKIAEEKLKMQREQSSKIQ